jgi:Ni/Co efflux regulator RcnB
MKKRIILSILAVLAFGVPAASAQTNADQNARVKEELRKLFVELDEAWRKADRATLERIYAPEFVWVHANGFVDNRAAHITDGLSIEARAPLRLPNFDRLAVYGDTAILKGLIPTPTGASLYSTSVLVKRDGAWQFVHAQGTRMLPERKRVAVDLKILDSYVGRYENDRKETLAITRENDALVLALRRPGIPKRTFLPTSDTRFFDKLGSEINFSKDETRRATQLKIRLLDGREAVWKKIN